MSSSINIFEFSVIIESKGNAEYLEEAINSVLNQSLGFGEKTPFKDNIPYPKM